MAKRKTAGQLAQKALRDQTKYDARELALESTKDIAKELEESIKLYHDKIDQDEFCVVMVVGSDPLIPNMMRRKFYCWPWLPSPRPSQSVFLYNKRLCKITKRLWVLPNPMVMAELATSDLIVHKRYQTMRDWSVAFFKGTFWEFIRYQHDIKMLSQQEYFKLHGDELTKLGVDVNATSDTQPFDFSKIQAYQHVDTVDPVPLQNGVNSLG